ncbi:MAG: penicillin-insensitive murein endopeptidase, partial [Mesorhizobium sp.]
MKTSTRSLPGRLLLTAALAVLTIAGLAARPAVAEELAKNLFGAKKLPAGAAP